MLPIQLSCFLHFFINMGFPLLQWRNMYVLQIHWRSLEDNVDVCNRLLLLLRAGDDPSANFYSYVSVDPFFNVSHLEDACFALDVEIFCTGTKWRTLLSSTWFSLSSKIALTFCVHFLLLIESFCGTRTMHQKHCTYVHPVHHIKSSLFLTFFRSKCVSCQVSTLCQASFLL